MSLNPLDLQKQEEVEAMKDMNSNRNELMAQVLSFEGTNVRVMIDEHEEPWFVAKDICECLGLTNPTMALTRLDVDEKALKTIETIQGPQRLSTVTEPGVYKLIARSSKPEAKRFWRWVAHDVLPSIRKTGSYSTNPRAHHNDLNARYLTVKEMRENRLWRKQQANELRAGVAFLQKAGMLTDEEAFSLEVSAIEIAAEYDLSAYRPRGAENVRCDLRSEERFFYNHR